MGTARVLVIFDSRGIYIMAVWQDVTKQKLSSKDSSNTSSQWITSLSIARAPPHVSNQKCYLNQTLYYT